MRLKLILCFLCLVTFGFGQESETVDAVLLSDGTKIIGQILDSESTTELSISTNFGGVIIIPLKSIKRIYPGYTKESITKDETGNQDFSFEMAIMANDENLSPSMQLAWHNQINEYFAWGIGTGVNIYNYGNDQMNFPVYLSARAFLSNGNSKAYFEVNGGYGFTTANEEIGMTGAKGGLMFNPKFGVRFGTNDFKVALFTGFKFQKSTYIYQNWGGEYNQKINHRRIEVGIGLHF